MVTSAPRIDDHPDVPPAGASLGAASVPDGWRAFAVAGVAAARAVDPAASIHARKRYGVLVFDGRPAVDHAPLAAYLDALEALSECVCELCGRAGVRGDRAWATPRCAEHRDERDQGWVVLRRLSHRGARLLLQGEAWRQGRRVQRATSGTAAATG